MKLENFSGIFFDLGWTLFRPKSGNWFFTPRLLQHIDPHIFNKIESHRKGQAYTKSLELLKSYDFIKNIEDEYNAFYSVYKLYASLLPELSITKNTIHDIVHDRLYGDNYALFEDVVPCLERLSKSHKLGIISDTYPSIDLYLDKEGLQHYFVSKTYSCYIGASKPSRLMYEHALKTINLEASRTLFIDDYTECLDGACDCGIAGILINRKNKSCKDKKHRVISKLTDLWTNLG